jgi:microcompartment protein CcmK/EutM
MQLGRVMGTVVATQRTQTAEGWTLRVVGHLDDYNQLTGKFTVAVDVLGADNGEVVLITAGSAARQTKITASRPCDAVIMAIVDTWALGNEVRYVKGRDE